MTPQKIHTLTIGAGKGKSGALEAFQTLDFYGGQTYAIVGPTGAGKSQLLEDISSLAQGDSVSMRHIHINGKPPTDGHYQLLRSHLIAHLAQSMRFVLDMTIEAFLHMRGPNVQSTLAAANHLAGEPMSPSDRLTALSGGQTRALMVADVAFNSPASVILIDELENAGIDRIAALELLTGQDKLVFLVTHDPLLALHGANRIIVKNGAIHGILQRTEKELDLYGELLVASQQQQHLKEQLRGGYHTCIESPGSTSAY